MAQKTISIGYYDKYAEILNTTPQGNEHGLGVRIIGSVAITGAGSGGTSSLFLDTFPTSGTAAGFDDGLLMRPARIFDIDTGTGTQYVLGVNLRGSGSGGSIEIGTLTNPIRIDPTGTTTQSVNQIDLFAKTVSYTYLPSGDIDKIETIIGNKKRIDQFNYDGDAIESINTTVEDI